MVECLGRFVEKKVFVRDFFRLKPSSEELTCYHQQFLNDSIVMGEASIRNARNIKKALEDYGKASRKIIS